MLRRLLVILAIVLLAPVLAALFMLNAARADPVVRRAEVVIPGLPADARIRVALLADIHIGTRAMDADRLHRIVTEVNALHPDLVLFAGDFIEGTRPGSASRLAPALAAPLARLTAPLGKVAVLGNHDHWTGPEAVREAMRRAGVTVLANQATVRGPLAIGGVDDDFSHHADVTGTMAAVRATGRPFLLLTHSPDIAPTLPADARLLLAGHTHCGQARLGPILLSPEVTRYHNRYRCGLVHDGERTVIVSGGLGTSGYPFRLNVPPDVWLVTLRG